MGLVKHMLETVAPLKQARSSQATASSHMSESIPRIVVDDRVGLANKAEKKGVFMLLTCVGTFENIQL